MDDLTTWGYGQYSKQTQHQRFQQMGRENSLSRTQRTQRSRQSSVSFPAADAVNPSPMKTLVVAVGFATIAGFLVYSVRPNSFWWRLSRHTVLTGVGLTVACVGVGVMLMKNK